MNRSPQLVVLGAGPAGIEAAMAAARHGVETLIVDQAQRPGGQVYRALPETVSVADKRKLGPDFEIGEGLRSALAASPVGTALGHTVWRVAAGFTVDAMGPQGAASWTCQKLIAATGAHERIVPFPGWTRPGVIGLAAATILLKSQQMLPGRSVVVAGCGPLIAAVAAAIIKGGGHVAAVADIASPLDWIRAAPQLAARPDLLARGLQWLRLIRSANVPILFRHTVVRAHGDDDGVTGVSLARVDAAGRPLDGAVPREVGADCLAIGHGLIPSTDATRALRARHVFDEQRGGWCVQRDAAFRTSVPGLYVCGDAAGIRGASAAALQGWLAGLTAARDLGRIGQSDYEQEAAKIRAQLRRADRFGAAMTRLMAPRMGMTAAIAPETVVCRCEDVTRAEIDDALATGAVDLNQLKSWTRAGMGPCQGRMCGETVGALAAATLGDRVKAGAWTGRAPLRPVPVAALIGDYRYEDIVWRGNKATIDDEGRPLSG